MKLKRSTQTAALVFVAFAIWTFTFSFKSWMLLKGGAWPYVFWFLGILGAAALVYGIMRLPRGRSPQG